MELNKIYNQDCLELLRSMDDNSIDLVVTSPPYNKGFYANKNAKVSSVWSNLNGRKIAYDVFSDEMPPEEYEAWQRDILNECMRVIKPSGSILYNHKDIIYNGLSVCPKWVYDYPLRQQIVWNRGSSPMIDPRYFMPIFEWIYWIVKDPKKVYFDKKKSFFKDSIWRITTDRNPHPAPFPLRMATSIVNCLSPENGVIFDPFMGSGTTAIAVLKTGGGRKYIGSEISPAYVEMAQKRINEEIIDQQSTLF